MVALGVFRGSGRPGEVDAYETWLGREVAVALDFVGAQPLTSTEPWKTIDNPGWWCSRWRPWLQANPSRQVVLTMFALPNKNFTLAKGAAGAYDAHWRKFGQALVAGGLGHIILRPMHENRVKSYPQYAGGQEEMYAKCWRRIITVLRSVPGQDFIFDWCPLAGGGIRTELTWPGGDHVDIVGIDGYDQWHDSKISLEERWRRQIAMPYGLNWQREFAAAHGKPMAIDEWGLTDLAHGGAGDNVLYLKRMLERLGEYQHATYFEVNARDGAHRLMPDKVYFPKSAAVYRAAA